MDTDRRVKKASPWRPAFAGLRAGEDVRNWLAGAPEPAASTRCPPCKRPLTRCLTAHWRRVGPRQAGRRHARDLSCSRALKARGNTPFGMVMQPRFRAGSDFMRLRADVGEVDEALVSGGKTSRRPTMSAATT